jgi:hypothetical protein
VKDSRVNASIICGITGYKNGAISFGPFTVNTEPPETGDRRLDADIPTNNDTDLVEVKCFLPEAGADHNYVLRWKIFSRI